LEDRIISPRHTIKTEVVITEKGWIASISKPTPGRVDDLEIRRGGPPLPEAFQLIQPRDALPIDQAFEGPAEHEQGRYL